MREVLIVTGETSGDLHASLFASALGKLRPDLHLTGVGGPGMEAAGVSLFVKQDLSGVMGFVEVLRHIPRHARILSRIKKRLDSGRVSLVVLVDYPGFNIRVADAATARNVPVLYYITPQVWAWGASRLPKLARIVTRAAVILPFEEQLLRGYGIDARFVGHPLLDRVGSLPSQQDARRELSLDERRPVLAVFPGSRAQEVERHAAPFTETARILERRHPGLQVVVSTAPGLAREVGKIPYRQLHGSSLTLLRAADAALCKSGTTTLEAAIAGCPLIVAYRAGTVSYMLARRLVRIPHIALVNVVAGREVAREFVQDAVQPGAMADALSPLLVPGERRREVMEALTEVRGRLGSPGAAERVAEMASGMAA
ncbi:MAG TPA: lipid-A-disaccharide synthase [Gemmatimonadaceae bacterium]|nr:lipid-A-disaccharide synthase [Gemmatimonadaceae bacterium]